MKTKENKTADRPKTLEANNATKNIGSHTKIKSALELTDEFIKAEFTKANTLGKGQNNFTDDCAHVAKALINNFVDSQTFQENDYFQHSIYLDIPIQIQKDWFSRWTKFLITKGRLRSQEGIYNTPIYYFV